jgi:hypothetical protein
LPFLFNGKRGVLLWHANVFLLWSTVAHKWPSLVYFVAREGEEPAREPPHT